MFQKIFLLFSVIGLLISPTSQSIYNESILYDYFPDGTIIFSRHTFRKNVLVRLTVRVSRNDHPFNINNEVYVVTNDTIYLTVSPDTRLYSNKGTTKDFSFQDLRFNETVLNREMVRFLNGSEPTLALKHAFLDKVLLPQIINDSNVQEGFLICDLDRAAYDSYTPDVYCCNVYADCGITPNSEYEVSKIVLQYLFRFVAAVFAVIYLASLSSYYDHTIPIEELTYVTTNYFLPPFFLVYPVRLITPWFYKNLRNWITLLLVVAYLILLMLHFVHIATPTVFPHDSERHNIPLFLGFFDHYGWVSALVTAILFPLAIVTTIFKYIVPQKDFNEFFNGKLFVWEYIFKAVLTLAVCVGGCFVVIYILIAANVTSRYNFSFQVFAWILCFISFLVYFFSDFSKVQDWLFWRKFLRRYSIVYVKGKQNIFIFLLRFFFPTIVFEFLFFVSNFLVVFIAFTVVARVIWTYLLLFILDTSQLQYYIFILTILGSFVKFYFNLNSPFGKVKQLMIDNCRTRRWVDIHPTNKRCMDYNQKRIEMRCFVFEVNYYCVPCSWLDFMKFSELCGVHYHYTKVIIVFFIQFFVLFLFYFGSVSFKFSQDMLVQVAITSLMPLIPSLVNSFGGEETELEKKTFEIKFKSALTKFVYKSAPKHRADGIHPTLTIVIPKVPERLNYELIAMLDENEKDFYQSTEWKEKIKREEELKRNGCTFIHSEIIHNMHSRSPKKSKVEAEDREMDSLKKRLHHGKGKGKKKEKGTEIEEDVKEEELKNI